MNARPKALMACHMYWDAPFQLGGHHLARGLVAAGWDVAFISQPISPIHLAKGRTDTLRVRFDNYRQGGRRDLDDHLWAYVPGAVVTPYDAPLLRDRSVHKGWWRLSMPNVAAKVRQQGFDSVDLVYLDSVVQGFWLGEITHHRSVLRLADRLDAFRNAAPAMGQLERQLAREVDLVIYAATTLEPYVSGLRPRASLHLPNGVDFQRLTGGQTIEPIDLAGIPHPIAMYVGWLADWFDFVTLDALAASLPDVSFVLIGPDAEARSRLTPRPNLHLIGPRPYEALSSYLHHADVGIIPFDVLGQPDLVNSIHPLKLYEYLACGLPVVATEWAEIAKLGSPAILCRTPEAFRDGIRRALDEPFDRDAAIEFARQADWSGRVRTLLEALDLP